MGDFSSLCRVPKKPPLLQRTDVAAVERRYVTFVGAWQDLAHGWRSTFLRYAQANIQKEHGSPAGQVVILWV